MISVCIPTYNGENFIKDQLESILVQLGKTDEVIISDDSSIDGTVGIIKKMNDGRIILLENNNFKNPAFNMENALKHASGDKIFLSDQDDIWLPDKVTTVLNYLKNYDLVLHDCEVIDKNDNLLHPSFFSLNNSRKGFIKNFIKNSYIGCCMAFNRNVLLNVLPFPADIPMHDVWIGLTAELSHRIAFVPLKLSRYRRHEGNITFFIRSGTRIAFRISYRLKLIYQLIIYAAKRKNDKRIHSYL